jgi:hypothetical protein
METSGAGPPRRSKARAEENTSGFLAVNSTADALVRTTSSPELTPRRLHAVGASARAVLREGRSFRLAVGFSLSFVTAGKILSMSRPVGLRRGLPDEDY